MNSKLRIPLCWKEQAEVLLPLPLGPAAANIRGREDFNILGKLKPGVTAQQAQTEMDVLTGRLRRDHPEVYPPNGGLTFDVIPLLEQVVGDVRRTLLVLVGSVGFVLLIAGANVANLLLSRALGRNREIAIRAALGASRGRLVRQLLTESVLLAVIGGVLGVVFAIASVRGIQMLGPKSVPRVHDIAVDGQALLVTALISGVAGILFGLVPALRMSGVQPHTHLKEAGRGSAAGSLWKRGNSLRKLLVVSELALSVVLLIGAGLLVRSFARAQNVPPGFSARNVLTVGITMAGRKYADGPTVLNSYRQLWDRLGALPGVTAVGGISALPLSQMFSWGPITVEGRIAPAGEGFINVDKRMVGARYFEAMAIPLISGRFFNDQDVAANPRVAIVDDVMAKQLWPGVSPLGKRIRSGDLAADGSWLTVVGVVGHVKQDALDADSRMGCYFPQTQVPTRAMTLVIRSGSDAVAMTAPVKKAIREIDPDLPVYQVRTMEDRVAESLARRRFSMLLLSLFAALALALSAIGTYGVMSYLVNQGTQEIGIRIALGATVGGVMALVVKRGMVIALTGVGIGIVAALALTGLIKTLLFGVAATDPLTFLLISAALIAVATLASWVPARRAARVDPMSLLRSE